MKPAVVLTCRWPDDVEAVLSERYTLTSVSGQKRLDSTEVLARCRQQDATVLAPTSGDRLDADFLHALPPSVRLIANYGAGTDNIDLDTATGLKIRVSNTPDAVTTCTADLTIGLMLSACRRFYKAEKLLRDGNWHGLALTDYFGNRMSGKTLGIVGLGRIGRAVARRAAAFDMQIVYRTPRRDRAFEEQSGAIFAADLDALFRRADIVSLHCGLNSETKHMLDSAAFTAMRPGTILVNTARGALIDERALVAALRTKKVAAAGLDVFEFEPAVRDELRSMQKVTLLPHIGTATSESRLEMGLRVVHNIDAFFATGSPADIVS